jgi:hypothetical protein
MKSAVPIHTAAAFACALLLNACEKSSPPQVSETKPVPEAAPAPEKPAEVAKVADAPETPKEPDFAPPVHLNGFGSDEPPIRTDEPVRGVIKVDMKDVKRMTAAHWEQFDCTNLTLKRWGRYEVRVTYTLRHATLGSQFRFGQQAMKKLLVASSQPKRIVYGEVYVEKPGTYPFVLYIAATGAEAGFEVHEIAFAPAPEGPAPEQQEDGTLVLEAKSATTWSENMRYEPKPEKNCLGFWTSEDDLAEWTFNVTKPGRFKVTVVHGCGGGNEGSEVALKLGGQELKFTTQDTGGFQEWKELPIGEIEIAKSGLTRLVIDPVSKAKSAVLDVQKVVLTPAG